ncbi:MAG: hypothetical protein ACLU80_02545 [Dorea sp.]
MKGRKHSVERGTHEKLPELQGEYARMGGLQLSSLRKLTKRGAVMLVKKCFALSDKGARDLRKRYRLATAAAHLCVMLPVSLLMTMTMALIDKTVGRGGAESNIPFILLLCFFDCAYLCHSVGSMLTR